MSERATLWSEFKSGDRAAYEAVVRSYYHDLYAYGIRLHYEPDLVKDCIHDLFVHIWERRNYLSDTDDVKLYLLKSLRNRMVKSLQKKTRFVGLDVVTAENASPDFSVEEDIVHQENVLLTERRVRRVLLQLSPRQREVVHLRYFEGLSNDTIARIMNISKPAVANLVHASLKMLRQLWRGVAMAFLLLAV